MLPLGTDAILPKRNETMSPRRNPLAFGTEPTDEELATVMREARDLVRQRKARSDAWMRQQLEEAVRIARAKSPSPAK